MKTLSLAGAQHAPENQKLRERVAVLEEIIQSLAVRLELLEIAEGVRSAAQTVRRGRPAA
jgi:hypothetical protein